MTTPADLERARDTWAAANGSADPVQIILIALAAERARAIEEACKVRCAFCDMGMPFDGRSHVNAAAENWRKSPALPRFNKCKALALRALTTTADAGTGGEDGHG